MAANIGKCPFKSQRNKNSNKFTSKILTCLKKFFLLLINSFIFQSGYA